MRRAGVCECHTGKMIVKRIIRKNMLPVVQISRNVLVGPCWYSWRLLMSHLQEVPQSPSLGDVNAESIRDVSICCIALFLDIEIAVLLHYHCIGNKTVQQS